MSHISFHLFFRLFAVTVLLFSFAQQADAARIKEVSPNAFEPIKAKVIDATPKNFTITVRFFANMFANVEAAAFALYTSAEPPKKCADFTSLKLAYIKPSKYSRQFDLSRHKNVLTALEKYQCVVVRNIQAE